MPIWVRGNHLPDWKPTSPNGYTACVQFHPKNTEKNWNHTSQGLRLWNLKSRKWFSRPDLKKWRQLKEKSRKIFKFDLKDTNLCKLQSFRKITAEVLLREKLICFIKWWCFGLLDIFIHDCHFYEARLEGGLKADVDCSWIFNKTMPIIL